MGIWRIVTRLSWPRPFVLRYLLAFVIFVPPALIATAAVGAGALGLTGEQLGGPVLGICGLAVAVALLPVSLGAVPGQVIWRTGQNPRPGVVSPNQGRGRTPR